MSFVAAVAVGPTAAADLERRLDGFRTREEVAWATHGDRAVAWHAEHSSVSSHDDGEVLVVVDGHIHNPSPGGLAAARFMADRYRRLGPDVARGVLGDYVVLVLDRRSGGLLVCRDPLGVRPWYQATSASEHVGASDVASLCAVSWVDRRVDDQEALAYLAGISQSRGPTMRRGVRTLTPGSTWNCVNGRVDRWTHHTWNFVPEPDLAFDEAAARCRAVVETAVEDRARGANALAAELSGGLDSSAVTGTAARLVGERLLVGRLLFVGTGADERTYSDAVIRHWGLTAVSAEPWTPSDEELQAWTSRLGRPAPSANFRMFAGLYRAFRERGRTIGLTGLGGDDAFLETSRKSLVASALRRRQLDRLVPVLRADLRNPKDSWRTTWRGVLGYQLPQSFTALRGAYVPPYVSPAAARESGLTASLKAPVPWLTGDPAVNERADALSSGYLASILEQSAVVQDAQGWRSSHPFLDPRVIEATYVLDAWFPVRHGHDRALEVEAFRDRLPDEVRDRRSKAEFSEVFWKPDTEMVEALATVGSGPLADRGWLSPEGFALLIDQVRARSPGAAHSVGRVLELDRWLRTTS